MKKLEAAYARALLEDPEKARQLRLLLDLRTALYQRDADAARRLLAELEDEALKQAVGDLLAGRYAPYLEAEPAFLAAEAWVQKGVEAAASGDLDMAEAAFNRALTLDEKHPRAHMNLGNVYLERGEMEAAKAAYDRALALAPDLADLHENLAAYYKKKGQIDAMVRHLKRAQRLRLYPAAGRRAAGVPPIYARFWFWLLLAGLLYLFLHGRGG